MNTPISGTAIIFFFVFALIVVIFVVVLSINAKTNKLIQEADYLQEDLEGKIKEISLGCESLISSFNRYQRFETEPPYRDICLRIKGMIRKLDGMQERVRDDYSNLNSMDIPEPRAALTAFLQAPHFHSIWKDYVSQYKGVSSLAEKTLLHINLGSQLLASLQKLPSVWARKTQEIKSRNSTLGGLVEDLERSGCYGRELSLQKQSFLDIQTRLNTLPSLEKGLKGTYGSMESIETSVILASRTIGELQPKIQNSLGVVESWCAKRTAMVNALNAMAEGGKKALSSFQLAPDDLDLKMENDLFTKINVNATGILKRSAKVDINFLESVTKYASDTNTQYKDLASKLELVLAKHGELVEQCQKCDSLFNDLGQKTKEQAQADEHPLIWNESENQIQGLLEKYRMFSGRVKRTSQIVFTDFVSAKSLAEDLEKVDEKVNHKIDQVLKLRGIRSGLRLMVSNGTMEWHRKAEEIGPELLSFAAENWEGVDNSPHSLLPSAKRLIEKTTDPNYIPMDPMGPVLESDVDNAYTNSSQLYSEIFDLEQRLPKVENRLKEIKSLYDEYEKKLQTNFDILKNFADQELKTEILSKLPHPVRSCLSPIRSEYIERGEVLLQEIRNKRKGSIQDKISKVNTWLNGVFSNLKTANVEIVNKRGEYKSKFDSSLKRIGDIAKNPTDETVSVARKVTGQLISYPVEVQLSGQPELEGMVSKIAVGMLDLSGLLTDWKDFEPDFNYLNENYSNFLEAKKNAQERIRSLVKLYVEILAWPPVSVENSIKELDKRRKDYHNQWITFREEKLTLRETGMKYSHLTKKYEEISTRSNELVKKAFEDKNLIEELKRRIEILVSAWQTKFTSLGVINPPTEETSFWNKCKNRYSELENLYKARQITFMEVESQLEAAVIELAQRPVVVNNQQINVGDVANSALRFIQTIRESS